MFLERSISFKFDDIISPAKIGWKGVFIQIDETAIYRRRIIEFSNKNDNTTNIQWLVRGVVQDNSKDIFWLS